MDDSAFDAKRLRIFVSSTDKFRHAPIYEMVIYAAKRYGMAGATAIKGVMGFGTTSAISSAKFWEVTEKLPMFIEIVDEREKIDWFIEMIKPFFDKIKNGCIITVEDTSVVLFKSGQKK
jgi:PII-like signaling protein